MTINGNLSQLPNGWIWTTIGEISEKIHYGYTASAVSEPVGPKLLRITDIQNDSVDWDKVPYCRIDTTEKQKYLLDKGDIVFARTGATVGKSFLVKGKIPKAVFASYLIRIILSKHVQKEFISNFFKSGKYWLQIKRGQLGIGQPNVNSQILSKITIPFAPLNEQKRIVSKVEQLFSFLDAGAESLRKVRAQLKHYRQAVLKYAFEGKLTEEWRKTHKDQIEPAQKLLDRLRLRKNRKKIAVKPAINESNEFVMPDSWVVASLEDVSEQIVDCLHSTPKFTPSGKYCIDTNCIEPEKIRFEKARFVSERTFEERIRRLKPKAGDVLFSREGTIGSAATVPENVDVCLGQRMMMFRPEREINPSYFMLGLLSPFFEKQWKAKVTGSTVAHINIRDIKPMLIPVASEEEQKFLSEKVEFHLSIANEVDKTLNECFQRSELMRQSILKDAFEGKLVPQNPNDAPAEKLLERIKVERTKLKAEGSPSINSKKSEINGQVELSRYVK